MARGFTLIAAGDVLLHDRLQQQANADAGGNGYDFVPMMEAVRSVVEGADLALCHMETPIAAPEGPFAGYPVFKVPPQIIPDLRRLGWDACSTASNHSIDDGEAGVRRTLDALDSQGMAHAGTARSAQEQASPTMVTINGIRIGLLSYTFGLNGLVPPAGKEWLANVINPEAIRQEAARSRAAGAEVVIVSLQWGTEYESSASTQQVDLAHELLAEPAIDLIIGHHVHVVQPFERIAGKWVAYGLGNHISNQYFSDATKDGVMARFTFTESDGRFVVTQAEALPTYMRLEAGPPRVQLVSTCPDPACKASAKRSEQVLRSRGSDEHKLRVFQ